MTDRSPNEPKALDWVADAAETVAQPASGAADASGTGTPLGSPTGAVDPAVAGMEAFLGLTRDGDDSARTGATRVAAGDATLPVPVPRDVAGYEVLGELGRGGMGVVYRARQRGLNRAVALKMVLAAGHAGPEELLRFRMEAEAVARLQHPHIVQVYETGDHDGRPFFSMELVDGPSLAQHLARELPKPREAAALLAALAGAVEYAHRHGIIHRDLKPANVLLAANQDSEPTLVQGSARHGSGTPGHTALAPKITDFGLAKHAQLDSGLTRTGAVMGTPSYMAPEQAAGDVDAIGPGADVYALGAVLYECLTGRPPFRAPTLAETLDQVRWREPVPPSHLQAGVPRDLEVVCLKCLRKDPSHRYPTAAALAEDLARFLEGRAVLARPVGRAERTWRWCRRNPAVAGLLATCALILAAGTAGTLLYALEARARARDASTAQGNAEAAATEAILARGRAEEASARATASGRAATRELVRAAIATGSNAAEAGELLVAMPWYQKAWEADRSLGNPDAPHRSRFAGLIGRLPVLHACFFHAEPVLQVRWHPSGRWLVARTDGNTIYQWDVTDPAAGPIRLVHSARVSHIALSRDGERLAVCGADGKLSLWSVPGGKQLRPPLEHPGPVAWAAFHPASDRLATACGDGKVRVWNLSTEVATGPVYDAPGPASFVAFDRSGTRLLVATETNEALVLDAATGAAICPPVPHLRRHLRIRGEQFGSSVEPCFSPDGETFAGTWNGPYVRRTEGGKVVAQIQTDENAVRRLEFSADGRRVLVQSKSLARWWEPGGSPSRQSSFTHPRESWVGSVAPGGKSVATASSSGKLHFWDPEAGAEITHALQHVGEIYAVAFSPDGSLVAAGGGDGTLRVWEPFNHALIPRAVPGGDPDSFPLAFYSPDRSYVLRASRDGRFEMRYRASTDRMEVVRRDTGATVIDTPAVPKMKASGFTPDGRVMYMLGPDAIQLWDVEAARRLVESVPLRGEFVSVAATADRVLVIDKEQFQVFNLKSGERTLGPVTQGSRDPAEWGPADDDAGYKLMRGDISPDARWAVIPGGAYRVLRRYDLAGGGVADVPLHDGHTWRAAFGGDGRRVLTSASDSTARLWDVTTGQPLGPPLWHPGFVRDGALLADGRTAATYADGAIRLWDAESGELLLPPLPHPSRPSTARVYFSADGRRLISHYSVSNSPRLARWTLPEFGAESEHVPALVGLFTGRRMDATGGLAPLKDEEVRRDCELYRAAFLAYHRSRPPLASATPPTAPLPRVIE